ncbi:hypothetical protein [Methylobacterium sp. UNC378MF]|jgi:hypothetical protein|uniref:hypothetical protein n=1 Tax=Methylobacterium sp. UNC378MF TaxID=1502748 RepID=UPI000B8740DB|nr:hypothetical protein [Methylobacterium sp. UNC378MF]
MPSTLASTRKLVFASACIVSALICGAARAEPPIRSPEDAACRNEARAKVFSAPNPQGLELEEIGRRIYFACMSRVAQAASPPVKRGSRRHRHRRP